MNATEKLVNMLQVIIEIKRIQNFLVKLGLEFGFYLVKLTQ